METVGISEFVKEQSKKNGKTQASDKLLNQITQYATDKLNNNQFKEGYRDGVIIIEIKNPEICEKFKCPIVKINNNTKLICNVTKRRENEENYLQIRALNGDILKTGKIELILYRKDVLKETNENSTNDKWELISFHAVPEGIDYLPMGPITMMRNQLQLPGGTKGNYSSKQWAESVNFWQKYAIIQNNN